MRGLTRSQRSALVVMRLGDDYPTMPHGPAIRTFRTLLSLGLIRIVPESFPRTYRITPAGRLALECDAAARREGTP